MYIKLFILLLYTVHCMHSRSFRSPVKVLLIFLFVMTHCSSLSREKTQTSYQVGIVILQVFCSDGVGHPCFLNYFKLPFK